MDYLPHIGDETAFLLARTFQTPASLWKASREELLQIHGVGEIVADALVAWHSDEENQKLLERLALHLKVMPEEATQAGLLSGKTVVITGTLPTLERSKAEQMVREAGGSPSGAVSRATSFVVAGESAGSKLKIAQELGVEIIDEQEFLKRLSA